MAFDDADTISTFDGPYEHPLSDGGTWSQTTPDRGPLTKFAGSPGYVTNQVGSVAYSTYIAESYDADVIEAFGCMAGGQLGAALETWRVSLFTSYGTSAIFGYLVYQGGALSKDTVVRRYDGNIASFSTIASLGGTGYPDRLGLRINNQHIEAWHFSTGIWHMVCSTADSGPTGDTTYRGNFYAGLGIEESGDLGFTCFGTLRDADLPQIYRRPNE